MAQTSVYGLDIETETTCGGVDPAVAPVRVVALSTRGGDELFDGDEGDLLRALDDRLADLRPGVVATWNGAAFDLPYLADRAQILGVELGLRLRLDPRRTLARTPLPGHAGSYRGSWHGHGHLDTFRLYASHGRPGPRTSLSHLGRFLGLSVAGSSTDRPQDLTNEAQHAHAPSDARLARVLAERRWSAASRLVEHVAAIEAQPVSVAARRLAGQERLDAVPRRPATASA